MACLDNSAVGSPGPAALRAWNRPYEFDPARKYPVLEYLYASPQIVACIDHEQVVLSEEEHGHTGVAEGYFIRKRVDFFDRNVMQARQ